MPPESAGLAMLAAAVVFTAPLAIWLRYSRHVNSAGGLYAFVEAAAGRRVALAQAAIWTFSYALYIVYTTVQIVYDLLPAGHPRRAPVPDGARAADPRRARRGDDRGARRDADRARPDGRRAARRSRASSTALRSRTSRRPRRASAPARPPARWPRPSAQTSLLYICGSLPLFLGGELATPARTIRRGLTGAFLVTGLVIVLAVAPLAAAPGLLHTEIPGVSVVEQFAGVGLARAIGIGVAVSTAGVILCEYLAVTRLVHAVTRWRIRPITARDRRRHGSGGAVHADRPRRFLRHAG